MTATLPAEPPGEAASARDAALLRVLTVALEATSLEEMLLRSLDAILALPQLAVEPRAAFFLLDERTGELVQRASRGLLPGGPPMCERVAVGVCHCGVAAATGRTIVARAGAPGHDLLQGGPAHGHVVTPIRIGDRVLGVLNLYTAPEVHDFREIERFTAMLAPALAGAISRRSSEEAARGMDADFRALVERGVESIVVYRAGVIVFANPAAARMLGWSSVGAAIGRRIEEFLHPDDRERAAARVREVWRTGVPSSGVDLRVVRSDGSTLLCEVSELRARFGGAQAIIAFARDVGARRDLQARAVAMDRMIAIGTLATGVAHEINNPLAFVLSNVRFAAEELDALGHDALPPAVMARCDEVRSALREAVVGAARVQQIVGDLKMLARTQPDACGSARIEEVIGAAASIVRGELRSRGRLVLDLPQTSAPLPLVVGAPGRLGQVVLNLLINAAQALPEGAPDRHEVRVAVTHEPAAGFVRVAVTDTGRGIAPEDLPRIFDPFFTTKPVGEGTGLGLSISIGIVRALGGDLTVASERGRGTTFLLRLPEAGEGAA